MKRLLKKVLIALAVLSALALLLSAYGGVVSPLTTPVPALATLALTLVLGGAIVLLIACLAMRQRAASLIIGVAILVSLPSIKMVCPMSWNTTPSNESHTFTVLSWNVCGFGSGATSEVLDIDADIVLLQEASTDNENYLRHGKKPELATQVSERYPYHTKGCSDVAILSKVPVTMVKESTMRNLDGNHTYGRIFDLEIKGMPLRIVSLHLQSIGLTAPNKKLYKAVVTGSQTVNTTTELKKIKQSLADKLMRAYQRRATEAQNVRRIIDESPGNIIVCGDFNDTPSSYAHRTIMGKDMSDTYADCGTLPINTYNKDGFYFKIDHILYRGDFKTISFERKRTHSSDHYAILATFEITTSQ